MAGKLPNLIASEDLGDCEVWSLPQIGGRQVLSSAEKEARDRKKKPDRGSEKGDDRGQPARDGEVIEDVEGEVTYTPMTAEQLQELSEAAERDGCGRGYGDGLEKGLEEGRQRGYEEALAESRQQAQETLGRQVEQLLQVAEALVEPIADQEEQLQQVLLQYVTTLTRQLVERELVQDSSQILSVVERAVAALPVGAKNVCIHLNPDDLALVETYAEERQREWAFRGDESLQPGGCRIESRDSLVDFSVESRLEAMLSQFLDRQLVSEEPEEHAADDPAPAGDTPADPSSPSPAGQAPAKPADRPPVGARPAGDPPPPDEEAPDEPA